MHRFANLNFTMSAVFSILGAIIMVYGLISPPTLASLDGFNINLWWGALTLIFGIIFGGIYGIGVRKEEKKFVSKEASETNRNVL